MSPIQRVRLESEPRLGALIGEVDLFVSNR